MDDDVWKQINLTSLNHHNNHHSYTTIATSTATAPATTTAPFHGLFFPDFLPPLTNSSISNKDPPKTGPTTYGSSVSTAEISVPTPGTVLSLSSWQDYEYLESDGLVKQNQQICSKKPSYFSHDYDVMRAHSTDFTSFSKKREPGQNGDLSLCDRRHKRMMKNRESAARSRSRRQAYTTDLELEIARLAEENAMLKKQHEKVQLLVAVASSDEKLQLQPKKHALKRTSTCPF